MNSQSQGDLAIQSQPEKSPRWLGVVFGTVLIALAGAAYWFLGMPAQSPRDAPVQAPQGASAPSGSAKGLNPLTDEQLERMIAQASALTKADPNNSSAWAMQAHSYEMQGKFSEAVRAYVQLVRLLPKDAQVLADYADVLAVANGRTFKGEPFALLKRAMEIDPKNAKALVLAGSAFVEEGDFTQAIAHLERARAATSPSSALIQQIDDSIAQARVLSGKPLAAKQPEAAKSVAASASSPAGVAAAQVSGRVWLAEALRAKAPPQATLFLFARPAEGSRMPVALVKKKVSDLPLNFTLDDSMAMVAGMGLSKQTTVVVVARISLNGNVTPSAGDLEGVSAAVPVGSKDLKLEITEVLK